MATVSQLIDDVDSRLAALRVDYEGLSLRQKVLRLASILKATRDLNKGVVRSSGCDARGGRERIELYFIAHVGVVLDAIELEVVGGISDYGRRIRELRVEDGYPILSGAGNDPEVGVSLKPTQYLLLRREPDTEAARRWHIANRIRLQKGGGAQDRILDYLRASVGQIVTSEELYYVGKSKESTRRARELRTEQGYAVATRFTGRPDLRVGEYVLEDLERVAPPHDRNIPEPVQRVVFDRDGNACRNCGWQRAMWTREDPRFLELHHVREHVACGPNEPANLIVVCNRCHDDGHAGRVDLRKLVPPDEFSCPTP